MVRVRTEQAGGNSSKWVAYRGLWVSLVWRDIRVRYRQSMLGIAWAVVLPLSLMLVFTFVFTRAIDSSAVRDVKMPYALYAFCGLVPWTFFSASLISCVNCLVANRNLVTKVYFPREVFPLSSIATAFVDFLIALAVLAALIVGFHVWTDWQYQLTWCLLALPAVVIVQIALTIGLGMLLSMGNLFYRDVRPLTGAVLQLWMFISAVVVPVPQDHSMLARIIALNPLVPIIAAYRDCIIHGQLPPVAGFAYATIVAVIFLAGGWLCFRRASYRFAECI